MVEIVGSVLMMVGGGMLSASALPRRKPTERARALFGDSDGAVTRRVPAAWTGLLDRLP